MSLSHDGSWILEWYPQSCGVTFLRIRLELGETQTFELTILVLPQAARRPPTASHPLRLLRPSPTRGDLRLCITAGTQHHCTFVPFDEWPRAHRGQAPPQHTRGQGLESPDSTSPLNNSWPLTLYGRLPARRSALALDATLRPRLDSPDRLGSVLTLGLDASRGVEATCPCGPASDAAVQRAGAKV